MSAGTTRGARSGTGCSSRHPLCVPSAFQHMPALLFPSLDAVRLALSSGVVPADVANHPVTVCDGEHGEVWVTPADVPTREVVAALTRMGVRTQSVLPNAVEESFPHWTATIPLTPDAGAPAGGRVLFAVSTNVVAKFVSRVTRLGGQDVRLHLGGNTSLVEIAVSDRTSRLFAGDLTGIMYRSAGNDVWVQHGWRHPLEPGLVTPPRTLALVGPGRDWRTLPRPEWLTTRDTHTIPRQESARPPTEPPASIDIPFRLRSTATAGPAESLWVLDGGLPRLGELVRDADERVLRRFEFAVARSWAGDVVILRAKARKPTPPLPPPFRGFVPHPSFDRLFLPVGQVMSPEPRPDRFAQAVGLDAASLVWVQPTGNAVCVHRVPVASFRPAEQVLAHTVPTVTRLVDSQSPTRVFAFIPVVTEPEVSPGVRSRLPGRKFSKHDPATAGWLGKIRSLFTQRRTTSDRKPAEVSRSEQASSRTDPRTASTLVEWTARRTDLERRVLDEHADADGPHRAALWAALATAHRDSGRAGDAAVCWLNVLWDQDTPPESLIDEWVQAEQRAARGESGGDGVNRARVAVAQAVQVGFARDPHADAGRLADLMRVVNGHEGELPVRAVWLARRAAARVAGGDPLALAACRDRLLARLDDDGPALDLDAPAFLRFHGSADGERFRTAREWLLHSRDLIHRWVQRQSTGERLGRAGRDPDPRPTTAYADLMLAWGLSLLGDRTKANEWAAQAGQVLDRCLGAGVDQAVHRELRDRFRSRIRAAQHGRTKPTGPTRPAAPPDPFSRYCVERLCERSVILAPTAHAPPFGGLDLFPLLGTDALGQRLRKLTPNRDAAAVGPLLDEAATDPTAGVLPRVVLAAAEFAPFCGPDVARRVVGWMPRVIDLLPEAVRMSDPTVDGRSVVVRLVGKAVERADRLAVRHRLPAEYERLAVAVAGRLKRGDEVVRLAVADRLTAVFGALKALDLTDAANTLLDAVGPDAPPVAWFVAGDPDRGVQELDRVRDRLYVSGLPDDRTRGREAVRYVAALALAPPRLALGRLAELFQRLGRVNTEDGAARYYALDPLELIDRAVTAVVSDEFDPGPVVRRWLADDEHLIRKRIARDLTDAMVGV